MQAAMKRTWILVPILMVGTLTLGCKEGDPLSGGISPAVASFDADEPPAGLQDHFVSLKTSLIDGGRIVLDIVVTEVDEPVLGIEMKLRYPAGFSKFTQCTDGDLFPPDVCLSAEPEDGVVLLGRNSGQGMMVVGEQVIARVEFLVFGEGAGMITIEGQNLGGGETSALLDDNLDPIFVQWFSGLLEGESVVGN
jgi:hypothetical protein